MRFYRLKGIDIGLLWAVILLARLMGRIHTFEQQISGLQIGNNLLDRGKSTGGYPSGISWYRRLKWVPVKVTLINVVPQSTTIRAPRGKREGVHGNFAACA